MHIFPPKGANPSALAFVQAPKPAPASFANEAYYSLNALKFISQTGDSTYFRYRVIPTAGEENLSEEALKSKSPDFLYEELPARIAAKESKTSFKLVAQIAEEGDVTDDATVLWPESRKLVELGEVSLEEMVKEPENAAEQKKIIFDPVPRIEGIDVSADPLLEMRAAIYLISGRQRRAA